MVDPDLQIMGGGGDGHPDPEMRGRCPKMFFWPFGPQFGLKNKGGGGLGPSGPSPGTAIVPVKPKGDLKQKMQRS